MNSTKMTTKDKLKENIAYIDYLRIFATFSVILLHVSASKWYRADVNGFEWQTFNFFDSISRWGVPVFVMISGALFIGKPISTKTILTKYIFRLLLAFLAWSFIYALFQSNSIDQLLINTLKSQTHLWFLLMICGVYICIPIISLIAVNKSLVRLYLLLSFIFTFLLPELLVLMGDFGGAGLKEISNLLNTHLKNMNMQFVMGYASYFMLGYLVHTNNFTKKQRYIAYILGLFGFLFTVIMSSFGALKAQQPYGKLYNYFSVNVLFEALSVFVWHKYHVFNNSKLNRIAKIIAKYCFGIYLTHILSIRILNDYFGLNTLSFNPIYAVLSITIISFFISLIISAILHQLPVIKKYLV